MSKSPLVVAQEALAVARRALPEDARKFSRRNFALHPLFALVVLRKFFRTDLRGVVGMVREWSELQQVLPLSKVPHPSGLWHVEQKLLEKGV